MRIPSCQLRPFQPPFGAAVSWLLMMVLLAAAGCASVPEPPEGAAATGVVIVAPGMPPEPVSAVAPVVEPAVEASPQLEATPEVVMETESAPESAALPASLGRTTHHIRHENVRVIAVGDIMMGTAFPGPEYLNEHLEAGGALSDLIGPDLLALLQSGNVGFGNLEGTLYEGDGPTKPCSNPARCYAFRSPVAYAGLLAGMGFNLMSVANNHAGDFLDAGRESTMGALFENGIAFAGQDRPGARTASLALADGLSVGMAAFAPNKGTVSIHDFEGAEALVRELVAANDVVIVSFHGGAEGADYTRVIRAEEEFVGESRGDVYAFAHRMIDAGAHLVLGHGPHVPRAMELYNGRLIAYSLGNFWTWGRFNLKGANGIMPVLEVELSRTGRLLSARIHSARQVGWGVPRSDASGQALKLIADLSRQDFPESPLTFAPDGTLGWPE
ncbi:MAG: CapA family protein [Nitrospirota bacterium]|nr:CapA family protein [Nitrospirota bacterium]